MRRRVFVWLGVTATVLATVAVRVPGLRSNRHIDFDEGVYGVSVLAMRDGFLPFRDVFSSQGPLFLPLLWLFDVVGLRNFRAVRIGMVLTAVAVTLGVYVIARRATGEGSRFVSMVAAAVVGTAGAGVAASGPIHSDGLALAFGVWAVAIVLGAGPLGRWRPLAVGMLIGAGMAIKSAFLLPAALAVAWHYGRRQEWPQLAAAAGAAALLGFVVALPWGLDNVWDQFVAFQIDAPRDREWLPNIANSAARLWRQDAIFLAVAAVGLIGLVIRLVRRQWPPGDRAAQAVVLVWLAATVVLLVFGTELDRGSYRFLIFLIAPAMAVFAIVQPPVPLTAVGLVAAVALVPIHLQGADRFMETQRLTDIHRDVVTRLDALPPDCLVVTDDPGLAWVAGRYPPPNLVDPSWARIRSGYIEGDDVRAGAARDDVCAVLFYTARFDFLDPTLSRTLPGYELDMDWGEGRRLYLKNPEP